MAANSLSARLWQYQKERFPLFAHGILIASFTFSALAFSHICRQDTSPMALRDFLRAFANTFCLFLLLRISDEFKDKDYDKEKRPHLPVPRGLVSLLELRIVGILVLLDLTIFNLVFAPRHLLIYLFVLCYLGLMFREFFVKHWLEQHQLWYVVSHMMIIPLVDTLASSFDWLELQPDVKGLCWFFAVSFFNGCTLELGRKIKVAENEEANTYSFSIGFNKAILYFQAVLFVTFCLCIGAAAYAGMSWIHHLIFILLYILCAVFSVIYTKRQTLKNARTFEKLSALWAVFTYLNLGLGLYF
jgi:hypothetical protein